jgi:hypothetical protein
MEINYTNVVFSNLKTKINKNKIISSIDNSVIVDFVFIVINKLLNKYTDLDKYPDLLYEYALYLIKLINNKYSEGNNNKIVDDNFFIDLLTPEISKMQNELSSTLFSKTPEINPNKDELIEKIENKNANSNEILYYKFINNELNLKEASDDDIKKYKYMFSKKGGRHCKKMGGSDKNYLNIFHKIMCENYNKDIDSLGDAILTNFLLYSYNYIKSKTDKKGKNITITYNFLLSLRDNTTFTPERYEIDISCNNYNYKFINKIQTILTKYDKLDFNNMDTITDEKLNKIKTQINLYESYLKSLNFRKKCVISDYTNQTANKLYSNFQNYKSTIPNIDIDQTTGFTTTYINNPDIFGEIYCYQIMEILNINITDANDPVLLINNVKQTSTSEGFFNPIDIFGYNISTITNSQWNRIFEKYSNELNDIIINAPEILIEDDFYLYRGSTVDYVVPELISDKYYVSTRFSSFTFDFDTSKRFSFDGTTLAYGVIYRLKVKKETFGNILFVAPISQYKTELEFLTVNTQIFKHIKTKTYPIYDIAPIQKQRIICPKNNDELKVNELTIIDLELM